MQVSWRRAVAADIPRLLDLYGPALAEHYQPNAVARASELMAELARRAQERRGPPLAAE